jgi:hypothetical protein
MAGNHDRRLHSSGGFGVCATFISDSDESFNVIKNLDWRWPGRRQRSVDKTRNLLREIGRYRISDLNVLLGSIPKEEVIVRKCLQASRFANRQAAALPWVRMNKVVPVFRDMAGHS